MKGHVKGNLKKKPGTVVSKTGNQLSKNQIFIFLGSILLLTFILYFNSLKGAILNWDDKVYIDYNSAIQKLDGSHIREIFTSFYASNYHPLTSLSWAIEYAFAGLEKVFVYHLDNILLHLLNIVLVFRLFKLISKNDKVAMIIALLHAIHPMHVESVAWIAERKDLLYSCFFLLSIIMYYKYLQEGSFISAGNIVQKKDKNKQFVYLTYSFLFFLLSLLSKSAAVILPPALILIDYLYKRKITARLLLEKLPFFALAVVFGILALKSQESAISDLPEYSILQKILIVNHSVLQYFYMAFLPVGQSALHTWPPLMDNTLPFTYYVAPVFTIMIFSAIVYSLRKTRIISFGILFFILNLILVIQLIPVGVAVIAERYSYMSYLGIFFIVATNMVKFIDEKNKGKSLFKPVIIGILVLATTGFSFATFSRVKVWQKDKTLWDDMITNYPTTAFVAYYNRAKSYYESKNNQSSIEDLNKLIEWKKYYAESLTLRGSIYAESGNLKDALNDYNNAIAFDSTYFLSYNNRGSARMKMNDLSGALDDFSKTIERKKDYYQAWNNRGVVKIAMKDFKGGMEDFNVCSKLNPAYCINYYGMGNAYSGIGSFNEAIGYFSKAIDCDGKYADAFINRGNAKIQLNDHMGAIEDFSKVIELDPNYSYAWFNRGRIKAEVNDASGATSDLQQSIQLNPKFGDAYVVLGNLKYTAGDKGGACEVWRKGAEVGSQVCISNVAGYCK